METLLDQIHSLDIALFLRFDRWGYAAVNGTHIFAIALLVGAILPLDLRLLGLWSDIPRRDLVRVLVPVAAAGLALALLTGFLLFSVKARGYAENVVFLVKMGLVATGVSGALVFHAGYGYLLEGAPRHRVVFHALLSMAAWIGALACGRLIGFTET